MLLEVVNLCKKYNHSDGVIDALKDINFTVNTGDFVTITGSSGSGKTTLLLSLAGLIKVSSGQILFDGFRIDNVSDTQLSDLRRRKIGFVMQSFALVPYLTALQNVVLPKIVSDTGREKGNETAMELLKLVGLENRKNHLPKELSAGQQQRVAIARALINNPTMILADEPTGNLDPLLAKDILNLLKEVNSKGVTVIMVTHSPQAAEYGNIRVHLSSGRLLSV